MLHLNGLIPVTVGEHLLAKRYAKTLTYLVKKADLHLSLIPTNDYLDALDNLRNFVEFPSEPDLICKFESAKRSQKTHFSPFLFHLFIFFTFSLLPFCHRSLIYVCLFHCASLFQPLLF